MFEEPPAGAMTHDGFYLQLGIGLGYMSTSAEYMDIEVTYSGITTPTQLLIGGSPVPGLVIGGGFITDYAFSPDVEIKSGGVTASGEATDVTLYVFGIGPFISFYPNPHEGLHFDALVGFGGLQASYQDEVSSNNPSGLLLSVAAGYEFWVGDEWSIGPEFRFGYGAFSYEDIDYPTIAPALLATFTYH